MRRREPADQQILPFLWGADARREPTGVRAWPTAGTRSGASSACRATGCSWRWRIRSAARVGCTRIRPAAGPFGRIWACWGSSSSGLRCAARPARAHGCRALSHRIARRAEPLRCDDDARGKQSWIGAAARRTTRLWWTAGSSPARVRATAGRVRGESRAAAGGLRRQPSPASRCFRPSGAATRRVWLEPGSTAELRLEPRSAAELRGESRSATTVRSRTRRRSRLWSPSGGCTARPSLARRLPARAG